MTKIQAIRGMNDVLPDQTPVWQYVEERARRLLAAYAYQEIRFPVLEKTQLFKRSIGEVTDIVEKEMYTFEDRNGDSLTLRPEGTACCVRAAEQHGLLYNQVQKLWYTGPMYRHERPQKGRYRQFYQLGVEAFGMPGIDIEAELLMFTAEFWKQLNLADSVKLEINNLGSPLNRVSYGKALYDYLLPHREALDEDSQRRLGSNVLRILDTKVATTREILDNAPRLADHVDAESQNKFDQLLSMLEAAGISYQINPSLVRGLDYYNGLVFEWTTDMLGSQGTVCAGGRFDGLVAQLGGKATPAVGFAMGIERLILLLENLGRLPEGLTSRADVYIAVIGESLPLRALKLAQQLRQTLPGVRVLTHCGGGKYNGQIKKAYASGARYALVLEEGSESDQIKVRALDGTGATQSLAADDIPAWLQEQLGQAFQQESGQRPEGLEVSTQD